MTTELLRSSVMDEIQKEMCAVTDSQIKRAEQKLNPLHEKDQSLGTITNEVVKRLYVLSTRLKAQIGQYYIEARMAESDEEESRLMGLANRIGSMQAIVSGMYWLHVRDELNLYSQENISVREAWIIVQPHEEPQVSGTQVIHLMLPHDAEGEDD